MLMDSEIVNGYPETTELKFKTSTKPMNNKYISKLFKGFEY